MAEAIGVAGLVLAIPSVVELLFHVTQKLKEVVRKYKEAEARLHERSIILNDHFIKLRLELEELRSLSSDLPQDLYTHFGEMFVILKEKIAGFDSELNDWLASKRFRRLKNVTTSIDTMIQTVDWWQRRIEDLFEQLSRFPKPFKDPRIPDKNTALGRVKLVSQAIFEATENTPEKVELPRDLRQLPNSVVFLPTYGSMMIVERKQLDIDAKKKALEAMTKDFIDLARILSAEDIANRGILKCCGYQRHEADAGKDVGVQLFLAFEVPASLKNPRSLRDILVDKDFKGQIKHPLDERITLAKQLARAVLHVHSKTHVHKNIRPEAILLFENADGATKAFPTRLGTAFLTGFERVRKDEADTVPIDNLTWAENIYRHPSRQGPSHPDDKFNMLHDVYSLGVCLLEISMWRSFVEFEKHSSVFVKVNNTKACNLMEPARDGLEPRMLSPKLIQEKFIRDARARIPVLLGSRFSEVVVRCLICVENFDNEAQQDPFIVGLRLVSFLSPLCIRKLLRG
jgi:hypothetical protein